jgi:hypothetical protein
MHLQGRHGAPLERIADMIHRAAVRVNDEDAIHAGTIIIRKHAFFPPG